MQKKTLQRALNVCFAWYALQTVQENTQAKHFPTAKAVYEKYFVSHVTFSS